MEMNKNVNRRNKLDLRVMLGIGLVIIGALILLNNIYFIDFNIPRIIFSFPAIIIFIGILILTHGNNKVLGSILLVVGVFLIIPRIFPWIHYGKQLIFPVLIIAFGLFIILRKRNSSYNRSAGEQSETEDGYKKYDTDRLNDLSIFGGGQKIITSKKFKGGNVTAIFGGSEIDFTNCILADGTVVIDVLAIFGGTTLIVPKEWNVILDVFPLFGGFSNKIRRAPETKVDMKKTLIIKGLVIFGGGEIKSY
ncbi:MAG: hypothetical protein IH949_02295 [Bacteroidetes bacterium]|nr:hypothetical protein [Bacteroidota bacterium]